MMRRHRQNAGFTIVEILIVLAIIAIGTAMVAMSTSIVRKNSQADGGARQIAGIIRKAREEAIAKRRNVKVAFNLTNNTVSVTRVEYDWSGAAPVPQDVPELTVALEGGVKFLRVASQGTIPGFPTASTAAVTYTTAGAPANPTVVFTAEGFATDATTNTSVDGTIFLGRTNEPWSTRAVTMTGASALVERWQWNKTAWIAAK
jgi:prepilin-type N-terminal cleavage/methylation domain-containing protein